MSKTITTTMNVLSFLLGLFLQGVRNKKAELEKRQDVTLAVSIDQLAEMSRVGGSVEFKDIKVDGTVKVVLTQ